ncbi:small multi-drug export protein [Halalkalibacter krulwichiae]|uniref:Putative small multi-drug export protein n=1 Tax=Halalkalibacter krulwichiae TaxID=199441 RepID=A0A1X9MAJ1_9BACI|nr:small multi-drug export protein [Halalkalibacter krulwichiae]ARK30418.1 Putative small multi-drug export protein [Halalkalibacter krulwichiae]
MDLLNVIWAYVLVFILSAIPFFEALVVVPLAILGGLHPLLVTVIAVIGNLLTVYLVIVFIEKIKSWRKKKKKDEDQKESKRSRRAQVIWKKYGLPGLALIGPFFVGSHLTALMSITLGGTKKGVAYWMTISLVAWCIGLAILAYLGFDLLGSGDRGFIIEIFNR